MSRQYDAKLAVLKAYPNDKQAGIDLFYEILGEAISKSDFEYEEKMSAEQYVYGINDE